jgi:hypothetical protein
LRIAKRIFLYLSLFIAVILLSATITIYLYQDRLIAFAIRELNKAINTPIQTEKVEVSIWQEFPHVTLSFHKIEIKESIRRNQYPLARLRKLHLGFNLVELLKGNYVIDKVYLQEGEVTIRYTKEGQSNYQIFTIKEGADANQISLDLKAIHVQNVRLNYVDEGRKQTYQLAIEQANARMNYYNGEYHVPIKGEVLSERIQLEEYRYFENKALSLDGKIIYFEKDEKVLFEPSIIGFGNGKFELKGHYLIPTNFIDLQVVGKNTKFESVLSFLPDEYADYFRPYRSSGDLYFDSTIKGYITDTQNPDIQIRFGSTNSSFYDPDYQLRLENTRFEATYSNGPRQSLRTSHIQINQLNATVDGFPIAASLTITDFTDYKLNGSFLGTATFARLYSFIGRQDITEMSGTVDFDFKINGKLSDFESARTFNRVQTSGKASAKNITFQMKDYGLPFNNLNGEFIFSKSDLGISSFSGLIGNTEFNLKGVFLNGISYLLFEDQPVAIEADLKSPFIDLDELLSGNEQDKNKTVQGTQSYSFSIPENVTVRFRSQLGLVKFRRFRGKEIQGEINLRNQIMTGNNLSMQVGGGKLKMDGTVNARNPKRIVVQTESNYERINVDSIFYIFEDFDQDWLTHKHLKGQINADINAYMEFDEQLNFDSRTFKATISASIKNGQMNNFEPMQSLSRFIEEEALANLRFSELKNEILIENRTIFLPEMEINSNVSNILITGQHTFDQRIDYRLVVPLKVLRKRDRDEAFGAIEDDGKGGGKLYLSITGTTDDYKVSWDGKRSVRQIGAGLKNEKESLKKAIRKEKEVTKKEVKPADDDYFDF